MSEQESAYSIYHVCQFSVKIDNFDFFHPILPKNGFRANEKCNLGIRMKILEILCVSIFSQYEELWLFRPKFAQKWILGSEFQKSKSKFGISTSKIARVSIFNQNGQLRVFRPKFEEMVQLRAIFWF